MLDVVSMSVKELGAAVVLPDRFHEQQDARMEARGERRRGRGWRILSLCASMCLQSLLGQPWR